ESEAALARPHRQAHPPLGGESLEHGLRQSGGLSAEDQRVACAKRRAREGLRAARGEREEPSIAERALAGSPIAMHLHVRALVVVEARAPQALRIHREAERLHEMQARARIRAEADHIPRVWRNLGAIEDDLKHGA